MSVWPPQVMVALKGAGSHLHSSPGSCMSQRVLASPSSAPRFFQVSWAQHFHQSRALQSSKPLDSAKIEPVSVCHMATLALGTSMPLLGNALDGSVSAHWYW